MLSQDLLNLLQKACDKSNFAYEHGGLSFHYSLSTSYKMTLESRARISKLRAEGNIELYPDEVKIIHEFFELAMNSEGTSKISECTKLFASDFLGGLNATFKSMPICILEPISSSLSSELVILILAPKYYHEIRLSWSPS